MRAGEKDGLPLSQRLSEFLFSYWATPTPHATTDVSPGELFLQQKLRTRFDLLKPDQRRLVTSGQATQNTPSNKHATLRSFSIGSEVMVRDFRHTDKWVPGTIVQKLGPVTYQVDIGSGNIVKRHIDQLTQRLTPQPVVSETNETQTTEDNFQ